MTAVHPNYQPASGFTIKSQSKTRDSSGICYYKQGGFPQQQQQQAPQIVPSDLRPESNGLEELGHDYFNTYLHLNDDAFFDECGTAPPKIDSTLPDLAEFGLIESPMSQDNDPFLPSFASAMLNASGENEAYRDLSSYLPSLAYLNTSTSTTSGATTTTSYHHHHQPTPPPPVSMTPPQPTASTSSYYTSPPPLMSTSTYLGDESRPSSSSPCSSTGGVERYSSMRKKNNMASRRSRLSKKEKERQMEDVASQLESENTSLRQHIAQLEAVTQRLRCRLLTTVRKN